MMIKNKLLSVLFVILVFTILQSQIDLSASEIDLSFDHFYDHKELTKTLKLFEQTYPQFVTVKSLGKSYQGREIWAAIINNPDTGADHTKPGYYIDGNIHGNEIQGTEVAIYAVWYLLKNYGKTDLASRLLNEKAFYVIPTMNPDSRDHYINKVSDPNSPRTGLIPHDDDKDGALDEDGPEDLDGDGSITYMRKKDPHGNFKSHPENPKMMIPVKPGEKGEYILLGQEGIDNDGDGRINEDGPGGYDMNRNYGYNWQPNYVQRGAGNYPFCFPETKATRDFLLAHPNILGAQNFHNFGGMILRGPGAKNLGEYPIQDRRVYDYIGEKGKKILPGYVYVVVYKDMYTVYGGSIDYLYNVLGIYTFTNELDMDAFGSLPFGEEKSEEKEDPERGIRGMAFPFQSMDELIYHDLVLMEEHYTDWHSYEHPLYGEIEIGGIKKFGRRVPPLFKLAETCHRNAAFCLYHADQLPRLEFQKTELKRIEKGTYQLDITIENTRVTPTISAVALQNKIHRVDRLKVNGNKVKLIAAGKLTDKFREITQEVKIFDNSIWVDSGIPGFGVVSYRFIIKGKGQIQLTYDSLKGGTYTKTLELN